MRDHWGSTSCGWCRMITGFMLSGLHQASSETVRLSTASSQSCGHITSTAQVMAQGEAGPGVFCLLSDTGLNCLLLLPLAALCACICACCTPLCHHLLLGSHLREGKRARKKAQEGTLGLSMSNSCR